MGFLGSCGSRTVVLEAAFAAVSYWSLLDKPNGRQWECCAGHLIGTQINSCYISRDY